MEHKWQENFDDLVSQLAFNYYACSFGDERKDIPYISLLKENKNGAVYQSALQDQPESQNPVYRTRNIVVVGAGTSMDSFSGLPGGDLLIKRMTSEQEQHFNKNSSVYNRLQLDKKEILSITGKDKLYFENYLYILNKSYMTQAEIRREMKKMTNARYSPVYFNELIAHMLKHSFVDAVINFNFEETLDQAILEELGEGNYYNIISDGHCVDLDKITANGTLKVPIYIKPHGTNSHKSSLRFTNKHYFDIPDDISMMLKCLVGGYRSSEEIETVLKPREKDSNQPYKDFEEPIPLRQQILNSALKREIDRVNIIAVGFNMESIEFLEILNNYLPTDSKIYYINYKEPEPKLRHDSYYTKLGDFFLSKKIKSLPYEKDPKQYPIIEESFKENFKFIECRDNPDSGLYQYEKRQVKNYASPTYKTSLPPLGRLFNYIYSEIWNSYREVYRPQHTHRHKLISLLFYNTSLRKPCEYDEYPGMSDAYIKSQQLTKQLEYYQFQQGRLEKEFEPKFYYDGHWHHNYKYFLDRTLVEIAIAFLRGHGVIDYFDLRHGRVNLYYKMYAALVEKHNARCEKDKTVEYVDILSLAELVKNFLDEPTHVIETNLIHLDFAPDMDIPQEWYEKLKGNEPFGNIVKKEFADLINNNPDSVYYKTGGNDPKNINNRKICAYVLLKLFTHKNISSKFINRNIANAETCKGIQRAKEKDKNDYVYLEMNHLKMIIHSVNYLVADNFYSISTQHQNTEFYTWQSFKLQSQLHTNLQLDYALINTLKQKDYDYILSVSEIGTNLSSYFEQESINSGGTFKLDKKIIQICAFDAVKQLYPDMDNNAVMMAHKKFILNIKKKDDKLTDADKNNLEHLHLFMIPFSLHNHHMTLFTKKKPGAHEFDHQSAIYIWRRGFSTQMNPILFKKKMCKGDREEKKYNEHVANDLESLYHIFIKYLDRGFLFNELNDITAHDECRETLKTRLIEQLNAELEKNGMEKIKDEKGTINSYYFQALNTFKTDNLNRIDVEFKKFLFEESGKERQN